MDGSLAATTTAAAAAAAAAASSPEDGESNGLPSDLIAALGPARPRGEPGAADAGAQSSGDAAGANANSSSSAAPGGAAAAAEGELWSSILNSVASSKAVPTKNVIVLGETQTGKSTLVSNLAASSPSGFINPSFSSALPSAAVPTPVNGSLANGDPATDEGAEEKKTVDRALDLGLGYGYFDVGDEDGEDVIARIGVYQLHSSHPTYLSLLPFAFPSSTTALPSSDSPSTAALPAPKAFTDPTTSSSSAPPSSAASTSVGTASAQSLRDSLILIVLDWETPWHFLVQLRDWLDVVHTCVEAASGKRGAKAGATVEETRKWNQAGVILDEMRERLEAYIRSYVEPSPSASSAQTNGAGTVGASTSTTAAATGSASSAVLPAPMASTDPDTALPLSEGTLTDNWGVPICVVCTKADLIPNLERERDFKEEQFDYIQQVLRTICLKYGAALFFTSHTRPQSFSILRSYILHRLFTPVASHAPVPASPTSPSAAPAANGFGPPPPPTAAAGGSTAFPFPYRASTVDRDTLVVPSGWDSWGKIRVLREGFDCRACGKGWEWDVEVERLKKERRALGRDEAEVDEAESVVDKEEGVRSAVKSYGEVVADLEADDQPLLANTSRVTATDEQAFLAKHYEALQKEDRDPRSQFRQQAPGASSTAPQPASTSTSTSTRDIDANFSGYHSGVAGTSVVGPMGSSSLSLPSVERVLMDAETLDNVGARLDRISRRDPTGRAPISTAAAAVAAARSPPLNSPSSYGPSVDASSARHDRATAHPSRTGATSPRPPPSAASPLPVAPGTPVGGGGFGIAGAPAGVQGSPTTGATQTEVLHSFFQSLLSARQGGSAAGAPGGGGGGGSGAGGGGGGSVGQPGGTGSSGSAARGSGAVESSPSPNRGGNGGEEGGNGAPNGRS